LGDTICTFTYNRATGKINFDKYITRSAQPFSMVKDNAFTYYIRITHNPGYETVSRKIIISEMFK